MFNFCINIKNPFTKGPQSMIKDILYSHFPLSKNKRFEIQFSYFTNPYYLAELQLAINPTRRDHGGALFSLTFFHLYFMINLYDKRHWDHDNDCWRESKQ